MSTQDADASLELLLDTICNTFGGVLFISMLVVVLLNMSSEDAADVPPEEVQQARLVELQRELQKAQAELVTLRSAVQRFDSVRSDFVTEESIRLAKSLRASRLELSRSVEQKNSIADAVADAQIASNEISQTLADQKQELEETREQLAAATFELDRQVKSRSRKLTLPTAKAWEGDVASFYLTRQTLCAIHDPNLNYHPTECRRSRESGTVYFDPVVSDGLRIDPDVDDTSRLAAKLRPYGPGRQLLRFWVSPDSHGAFAAVHRTAKELGFRIEIVLLGDGVRLHQTTGNVKSRGQ